jgi:hypothetical protein
VNRTTLTHRGLRRVLGLGLGVAVILAMAPGVAWAQDNRPPPSDILCGELAGYDRDRFDDTRGSAHERNVLCMADYGLTEGQRGGESFGPRRDVNRGQMASFIARFIEDYLGEELDEGGGFRDVPNGYVHAENINKLQAIGVTEGTRRSSGREFAPLADVTRAQMASFVSRALTFLEDGHGRPETVPPRTAEDYYVDHEGSVHRHNIDSLAWGGIASGFADGTYRPERPVKRDQMASYVMRAYGYAVYWGLGFDFEVVMTWEEEVTDAGVPGQGQPGAEGYALLAVDEDANSLMVMVDYSEVAGPFAGAPGSHIHEAARGTNGPVVVTLATGEELDEGDGFWWATVEVPTTGPGAFDVSDLFDDPGSYYLNLHSDAYPAGAIRGQLRQRRAIPEAF